MNTIIKCVVYCILTIVFYYYQNNFVTLCTKTECTMRFYPAWQKRTKNLLQRVFLYLRSWDYGRLEHKNNMHHRRKANRFYCRDVLWWQLSNWNWRGSCNAIFVSMQFRKIRLTNSCVIKMILSWYILISTYNDVMYTFIGQRSFTTINSYYWKSLSDILYSCWRQSWYGTYSNYIETLML